MKKLLVILLFIIFFGGIAVVTCPDKEAHTDAIMSVVNEKINDNVRDENKSTKPIDQVVGLFGGKLISGISSFVLDQMFHVENHFVYSQGIITTLDGTQKTISIGVFGHVFTFDKEDLDKALKENL